MFRILSRPKHGAEQKPAVRIIDPELNRGSGKLAVDRKFAQGKFFADLEKADALARGLIGKSMECLGTLRSVHDMQMEEYGQSGAVENANLFKIDDKLDDIGDSYDKLEKMLMQLHNGLRREIKKNFPAIKGGAGGKKKKR